MEGRKVGLPGPTELFTLRFQTVWMRDKASTLLGTAKNIRFQNTEYKFLLLFSIMAASEWYYHHCFSKMWERRAALEGGT